MLLGPIRALYSLRFYINRLKKSAWRATFFLVYIFLITAVISAAVIKFTISPRIAEAVDTMVDYLPEMNIVNGTMEVNDNKPLKISPDTLQGYNIVFDTGRTDPVYAAQMKSQRTIILVGAKKIYFAFEDQFNEREFPADLTYNLNREALNASKEPIANFAMAMIIFFIILSQTVRLPFLVLIAFLIMIILSNSMRAPVKRGDNYKMACYVQSPAALIYIISFFVPIAGFLIGVAYLGVFIIYGQIVFNALKALPDEDNTERPSDEETAQEHARESLEEYSAPAEEEFSDEEENNDSENN